MAPDKQAVWNRFDADETVLSSLKTKNVTLSYQEKPGVLLCVALAKQSRWRVLTMNI